MFKCPYCREYLHDDATQCQYCGKTLVEEKPDTAPIQAQSVRKAPKAARKDIWLPLSGLFVLLSVACSILIVNLQHGRAFPLIPSALIILCAFGIVLSLTLTRKGSTRRYPLLALCLPALVIGSYGFIKGMISYDSLRREGHAAQQKLLKQEAEKKRELEYILAHREELYQEGLAFLNDEKYQEAGERFARVLVSGQDYKDAAPLLSQIEDILSRKELERKTAEAKDHLAKAEKLLKSESCSDFDLAIQYAKEAKAILLDEKKADRILQDAELLRLTCFEGNDQIQMAVQVQDYKPLKLLVWIKNLTTGYREANPGFFTLVTVTGRSYRVSNKTYDMKSFFDAVLLRPKTETSGSIIFDTYDKPKKLTYKEISGTSLSREFPFE